MSDQTERGEWPSEAIPQNWAWLTFKDFWVDHTDSRKKLAQNRYQQTGPFAVVDQGEKLIGGFTDDRELLSSAPTPAVIFGDHTRVVKLINRPFVQGADGVRVLGVPDQIDVRFACHALRCVRLPDKGYSRHFKFLKSTSFPLPPFAEQRRIVAKIDSLSVKAGRARNQLEHIPRLVEKYKQAVLAAAYNGLWTIGEAPLRPLHDFVQTLDQGWSPKCESDPGTEGEWAVMKTTAVQPIEFVSGANKRLPKALQPRPQLEIRVGDVIITRAGPRSRVGITCVVKETRPRLMLCDKAYRLRAVVGRVEPVYLALMLNAPDALLRLETLKTGINDSGLNLTQSKFLALDLPCPSIAEQRKIVRRVEAAFTWIDRLAKEAASAQKLIDNLDRAVLAKGFRGELLPQDPNDEPAIRHLERIRSERAEAPSQTRRRVGGLRQSMTSLRRTRRRT